MIQDEIINFQRYPLDKTGIGYHNNPKSIEEGGKFKTTREEEWRRTQELCWCPYKLYHALKKQQGS